MKFDIAGIIASDSREIVKEIFDLSQEYCPVITGRLKASGSYGIKKLSDNAVGYVITYSAPYASDVEDRRHFVGRAVEEVNG